MGYNVVIGYMYAMCNAQGISISILNTFSIFDQHIVFVRIDGAQCDISIYVYMHMAQTRVVNTSLLNTAL